MEGEERNRGRVVVVVVVIVAGGGGGDDGGGGETGREKVNKSEIEKRGVNRYQQQQQQQQKEYVAEGGSGK